MSTNESDIPPVTVVDFPFSISSSSTLSEALRASGFCVVRLPAGMLPPVSRLHSSWRRWFASATETEKRTATRKATCTACGLQFWGSGYSGTLNDGYGVYDLRPQTTVEEPQHRWPQGAEKAREDTKTLQAVSHHEDGMTGQGKV